MILKLIENAAAKTSLINMKYDMQRLVRSYPNYPESSTKEIVKFTQNACLALLNGASIADVHLTVQQYPLDEGLRGLLKVAVDLAEAISAKDELAIDQIGGALESAFTEKTGVPMVLEKKNLSSSNGSDAEKQNSGCGCLLVGGLFLGSTLVWQLYTLAV